jgi:hypothetical protein
MSEYNPFQSPESLPLSPAPSYLVPDGLVRRRGRFTSARVRAICAMVALGVVALFDAAAIYLDCLRYKVIWGLQYGQQFYYPELSTDRFTRFVFIKAAAEVATVVLWLCWIHRAYSNLSALGNPVPSATPAWAAGSYFVPVVNFFIPYTIMAEIWRYSDPAQLGVIHKTTSRLVGAWWAMFCGPLIPIAGLLISLLATPSHSIYDEMALESLWLIGVPIANLGAAILAIVLVYSIDKNQRISHDLIERQSDRQEATR